jgi:hypothetical protein
MAGAGRYGLCGSGIPSPWPSADIAALDDLDIDLPADPAQGLLKLRP